MVSFIHCVCYLYYFVINKTIEITLYLLNKKPNQKEKLEIGKFNKFYD